MPSAVSQKWLAMHLKCPSRMMDLFTAAAIWLEKIHVQQLDIEKRQHFAWRFFQSGLQFQVSNLPKKGEQTQLFMEKNLNRRFSNKKFEVLVLLLPVAIVSPYAAWKAWRPTFEPLASPPKIEFKSIEVPFFVVGISCGFVFCVFSSRGFSLLFYFFLEASNFTFFCRSHSSEACSMVVKSHLIVSQIHQVKNPMQNFVEGFSSLVVERDPRTSWFKPGAYWAQGFPKTASPVRGSMAPGWLCWMLEALWQMSPSVSFHLSPKWLFPGFWWQDHFQCVSFHFFYCTCLPDLRDDCSLLAGSFSDVCVCVLSFLFICFHTMILLPLSWPDACPARITFQCAHGFRCWMPWPDHFPASLSAFVYICLPHGCLLSGAFSTLRVLYCLHDLTTK